MCCVARMDDWGCYRDRIRKQELKQKKAEGLSCPYICAPSSSLGRVASFIISFLLYRGLGFVGGVEGVVTCWEKLDFHMLGPRKGGCIGEHVFIVDGLYE